MLSRCATGANPASVHGLAKFKMLFCVWYLLKNKDYILGGISNVEYSQSKVGKHRVFCGWLTVEASNSCGWQLAHFSSHITQSNCSAAMFLVFCPAPIERCSQNQICTFLMLPPYHPQFLHTTMLPGLNIKAYFIPIYKYRESMPKWEFHWS